MLTSEGLWENLPIEKRFIPCMAPERPAARHTYLGLEIGELPSGRKLIYSEEKTYDRIFNQRVYELE